jgi:protein-disulfide isomerase
MSKRHWVIAGALAALLLGLGAWTLMRPAAPVSAIGAAEAIARDEDHMLGNKSARVTVIEYAAPICPTCAFVNAATIPELKRRFIDTGKILFVFRVYPLNPADFKAEGLARCVPQERYFQAIDLLYRRQEEWGAEHMQEHGPGFTMENQPRTDAGLIKIGRAFGFDEAKARGCMRDANVHRRVQEVAARGEARYGIGGTPTFIVNGRVLANVPRSVDDLAAAIDPLLAP